MNSVKLGVYIYISYSWIIVVCIYLYKHGVQRVLFDVLFLMLAVLFHFLQINKIKNRLIFHSTLSGERSMLIKYHCQSACMETYG